MSGMIDVRALRDTEVIAPKPGSTTQWVPFVSIDHWQLLALLDAVEALRDVINGAGIEWDCWYGQYREIKVDNATWGEAQAALARFDFGGES